MNVLDSRHCHDYTVDADDGLLALVTSTADVAKRFHWPHGRLNITIREVNIGLAHLWYEAWDPAVDNELCFIFEDDVEVSPLFFEWAVGAAEKYYTRAVKFAHWELQVIRCQHMSLAELGFLFNF